MNKTYNTGIIYIKRLNKKLLTSPVYYQIIVKTYWSLYMNETDASMRLVNNTVLSENGIRRLKDSLATIIEPAHI